MYFNKFPYVNYDLYKNNQHQLVTDILKRVKIRNDVKNNGSVYFNYTIKDSDTPEGIANKIYGNPKYSWIIYHMNDYICLYRDWPMPYNSLIEFTKLKYGTSHINDTHHYEDGDKNWVNSDYPLAAIVTNLEYESEINEEKRSIKLLNPDYVGQVERELEQSLLQSVKTK